MAWHVARPWPGFQALDYAWIPGLHPVCCVRGGTPCTPGNDLKIHPERYFKGTKFPLKIGKYSKDPKTNKNWFPLVWLLFWPQNSPKIFRLSSPGLWRTLTLIWPKSFQILDQNVETGNAVVKVFLVALMALIESSTAVSMESYVHGCLYRTLQHMC